MHKTAAPNQTLASLASSLQQHVLDLIETEKALVRFEVNLKVTALKRASISVATGATLAGLAVLALAAAGILALSIVLEPWAAALVAAGITGLSGVGLWLIVRSRIKRFEPVPHRSVESLEQDVRAMHAAVAINPTRELHASPEPNAHHQLRETKGQKNSLLREIWETIKETGSDWSDDNASRLAAALAYYALLSLAPLLVIAVAVAGFFFGTDAARGKVAAELGGIVGGDAAQSIQTVVNAAESPAKGVLGTIAGVATLFFGASGVFGELQSSMNTVWEVKPKPGGGLLREVRRRFFSFTMVLGVAFLLLISLVVSSVLSSLGAFFEGFLPGGEVLWQVLNFAVSLAIVALLFAVIFKYLPDAKIRWADVWVGGAVTALLFTIGKFALGLYIGKAAVGSAYGAAGSIIALVVWVYYATQIFLLGAEFTQVQARRRGRQIQPNEDAVATSEERAQAADAGSHTVVVR
jgi:membrane protein